MKSENKNKAGRPFKMQSWLNPLAKILEDESTIFLSDKDLVVMVNRLLPEDERISQSTFEKWKGGKFAPDEELGREFIACMELSLIRQKQLLGEKLLNDTSSQWTRYAWVLERKFAEWNLKHISENINKNEQSTVIQITAGNDAQRNLIENLINTDYIEIKPSQLPEKNEVEETDNEKEDDFEF